MGQNMFSCKFFNFIFFLQIQSKCVVEGSLKAPVIVRPRVLELRVIIIYRKYIIFIPDAVMRIPLYTCAKEVQVYSTGPDDVTNYTKIYGMFGRKQ